MMGEWSSAGNILKLTCGGPWFAALPREAWPDIEVGFFVPSGHDILFISSYVWLMATVENIWSVSQERIYAMCFHHLHGKLIP